MAEAGSSGSGGSIDLGLQGSTIVVTGAGSGIGAATARLLGAAGASIVLVGDGNRCSGLGRELPA